MDIAELMKQLSNMVLSWPLIISVLGVGVVCTIACKFVQLRYFFSSWKFALFPDKTETTTSKSADMSPLQAFMNALSSNLGNGSIGGVAVAIYAGGPGAAVWIVLIGLLLMAVRFAEVYLSARGSGKASSAMGLGGPMLYLQEVVCGKYLAYAYAASTLLFGFLGGCAVQTNTIQLSMQQALGITSSTVLYASAVIMSLFVLYIVSGGAKRIVKVSTAIVPIKVVVFFISALIVLCYHYAALIPAIRFMIIAAFSPQSFVGGVLGFTIQQAMRSGMLKVIFATESGLGTAPILFGGAASKAPVKDGIMSMLSTFISTLVCFSVALMIVASGMWDSGLTSTALTVATFNTVFGTFGGAVVTFLSASFGIGVLVAYAYITRAAWLYVTGGRWPIGFVVLYCLSAFGGAVMRVGLLWNLVDIISAAMLVINLFGLMYLLPSITKGLRQFSARKA